MFLINKSSNVNSAEYSFEKMICLNRNTKMTDVVSYVQYIDEKNTPCRDLRTKIIKFPDSPFRIVHEPIGSVFNRETCALHLAKFHPNKKFSEDEIDICYYIMSMLIRKANTIEPWDAKITNWYHDDEGGEKASYLVHRMDNSFSKIGGILTFLNSSKIRIWFKADKNYDTSLVAIIKAKGWLKQFLEYWRNVPSYDDVFRILNRYFPRDICDKIICLAAKKYG